MTNPNGRFGIHGGQYIPETLMNAVIELEEAYNRCKNDPEFNRELTELLNEYAGRPSRLYYAEKMTRDLDGAKIYLKREDLNHTGAHKINNVLGQALLAKKMGKTRLIAETGAGQHGVATATAAALMGMECVVFMGEEDTVRQARGGRVLRTLERDELFLMQTPQVFRTGIYRRAHASALSDGFVGTDDSSLIERLGGKVLVVEGKRNNIKLTVPEDYMMLAAAVRALYLKQPEE